MGHSIPEPEAPGPDATGHSVPEPRAPGPDVMDHSVPEPRAISPATAGSHPALWLQPANRLTSLSKPALPQLSFTSCPSVPEHKTKITSTVSMKTLRCVTTDTRAKRRTIQATWRGRASPAGAWKRDGVMAERASAQSFLETVREGRHGGVRRRVGGGVAAAFAQDPLLPGGSQRGTRVLFRPCR